MAMYPSIYRSDTSAHGSGASPAWRRTRGRSGRCRGRAAYPGRVRSQRQMVDYALQRRALLADVHAGRVPVAEVCDASPYLLRAARFHGEPERVDVPGLPQGAADARVLGLRRELGNAAGSARRPTSSS